MPRVEYPKVAAPFGPGVELQSSHLNAMYAELVALRAEVNVLRAVVNNLGGFVYQVNRERVFSASNLTQLATIPPRR
jgi:hypothetical protein